MKRTFSALGSVVTFAGCAVLGCTSCSTWRLLPATPAAPAAVQVTARLAQMSFGANANYAVCIEPACPKVTPKTFPTGIAGTAQQRTAALAPAPVTAPAAASIPQQPAALRPAALEPPNTRTPAGPAILPLAVPPVVMPRKVNEAAAGSLTVTFPFGSTELSPAARAAIKASLSDARRAARIVIAGRTDDIGDGQVNGQLALHRAIAVRNYYRELEADLPATFAIDAKGACCYVATNTEAEGRSKNRRVEIVFNPIEGGV